MACTWSDIPCPACEKSGKPFMDQGFLIIGNGIACCTKCEAFFKVLQDGSIVPEK